MAGVVAYSAVTAAGHWQASGLRGA
jgi:hypothetical protein